MMQGLGRHHCYSEDWYQSSPLTFTKMEKRVFPQISTVDLNIYSVFTSWFDRMCCQVNRVYELEVYSATIFFHLIVLWAIKAG